MRGCADAGRPVDGKTAVTLVDHRSLAGVDPDTDAHGGTLRPAMLSKRALRAGRRPHRLARAPEGGEEAVAVTVDLDPAGRPKGVAQQPAVCIEHFAVPRRAERLREPRRALDVGEQERDRAGREIHRVLDETVKHPRRHAATDAAGQTLGMSLG